MGAFNCKNILENHSNRNIRAFITDTALERDAFIVDKKVDGEAEDAKFYFRKDVQCVRVLADNTEELPWKFNQFLSVFVEDANDQEVCSKQIILSMAVPSPFMVLLCKV